MYFENQKNVSMYNIFTLFEKNLTKTLCEISKSNPLYIIQRIPELCFNVPQRIFEKLILQSEQKNINFI